MSNLEVILGVGVVSWRYVLIEVNFVDDIIRGLSFIEFGTGFRYSSGFKFLYELVEFWLENKVKVFCENDDMKEKKKERWVGVF